MNIKNRFGYRKKLELEEGDRVEIIVKSSLYCNEDETPESHSGTVISIEYDQFTDGENPFGIYVKFNKDSWYEDGDEELVLFEDIEDVFIKKFDITGYAKFHEGMTLSVKGEGINKIIWFKYDNGSLLPESISDGSITERNKITEDDSRLIQEINKYGTVDKFSHFVFLNKKD